MTKESLNENFIRLLVGLHYCDVDTECIYIDLYYRKDINRLLELFELCNIPYKIESSKLIFDYGKVLKLTGILDISEIPVSWINLPKCLKEIFVDEFMLWKGTSTYIAKSKASIEIINNIINSVDGYESKIHTSRCSDYWLSYPILKVSKNGESLESGVCNSKEVLFIVKDEYLQKDMDIIYYNPSGFDAVFKRERLSKVYNVSQDSNSSFMRYGKIKLRTGNLECIVLPLEMGTLSEVVDCKINAVYSKNKTPFLEVVIDGNICPIEISKSTLNSIRRDLKWSKDNGLRICASVYKLEDGSWNLLSIGMGEKLKVEVI